MFGFFTPRGPLIVYVHVPKTAGSSLNAALRSHGRGDEHIERYREKGGEKRLARAAARYRWVSGHVPIDEMLSFFSGAERELQLISLIREPKKQVRSQLNWLIEIRHRGRAFYESHPPMIRSISERISTADLSTPQTVIEVLSEQAGLFLNYQSRYLSGPPSQTPVLERLQHLPWFSIGTVDRVRDLYKAADIPIIKDLPRKNTSRYHFDPDVFEDASVKAFLAEENGDDQAIWDFVASHDGLWHPARIANRHAPQVSGSGSS